MARFQSVNSFAMSGRLMADAQTNDKKGYARFTIIHNFGKGMTPLFFDVVMFPKNGSKDVKIPWNLLKKGTPVTVSGFSRPNVYTNETSGKIYRSIDHIALEVNATPEQVADAEDTEAAEAGETQETQE